MTHIMYDNDLQVCNLFWGIYANFLNTVSVDIQHEIGEMIQPMKFNYWEQCDGHKYGTAAEHRLLWSK